MSEQQLTDLTRGMHHAASTTAAMIAQQYIRIIDQFFDAQEDGSLVAKMVKIHINDDHYTMVPLISLVAPKGIALEKMRVEMSVKITEAEMKEATDKVDNSKATRSSFKVQLAPKHHSSSRRRDDLTDIEMIFTAGDPPEGIMRIIDQYTDLIKPIKDDGNGNHTEYHTIGIGGTGNGDKPFKPAEAGPALEPIEEETTKSKDNQEGDTDQPGPGDGSS